MKTETLKRSALGAWVRSLPLALGLPAVLWVVFDVINQFARKDQIDLAEIQVGGMMLGIATAVHFVAYLVTGPPIFLSVFRDGDSRVWMPVVGIPLGGILGALMASALVIHFNGLKSHLPWGFVAIGAGYGVVTAIAALRQRPTI